jgi:hypothetical protein
MAKKDFLLRRGQPVKRCDYTFRDHPLARCAFGAAPALCHTNYSTETTDSRCQLHPQEVTVGKLDAAWFLDLVQLRGRRGPWRNL